MTKYLLPAMGLAALVASTSLASGQPTMCLPAGSAATGLSTGLNLGGYRSIRFSSLRTSATRVVLQVRNGSVIYDGPPTVGRTVNLVSNRPAYVWWGFKSGAGNHMNGICVELLP